MMKLTPNGGPVSSRTRAPRRRISSGGAPAAPSTPRPPAAETAATKSGPAAAPHPGAPDRMLDALQGGPMLLAGDTRCRCSREAR
jgi:hypothetical protein